MGELQDKNEEDQAAKSKYKYKALKRYAALSGIGIQMGAIIFLCAWAGRSLDARYAFEKDWFTIGFVLFGVAISIFFVIKQLRAVNDKFDD